MRVIFIFFILYSQLYFHSVSANDGDYYKLENCFYSHSVVDNEAEADKHGLEIGDWRETLNQKMDSDDKENSLIIDIKNNTIFRHISTTDEGYEKQKYNDAYQCENYGHCYELPQVIEASFFIKNFMYPSVKALNSGKHDEFIVNLDEASFVTGSGMTAMKYTCEMSDSSIVQRKKKIYPYKDIDIATIGGWTEYYYLDKDSNEGSTYKRSETGLMSITIEPYPISERNKHVLKPANNATMLTAKPEDLFLIKLTDNSKNIFGGLNVKTKEFIGTVDENQILGVNRISKWNRDTYFNYSNASDYEKKYINWKIQYLETEKITIDLITGQLSWFKYNLDQNYSHKSWYQNYLTDTNKNPEFKYDTTIIGIAGLPMEIGAEAYVDLFMMPDPVQLVEESTEKNIFAGLQPDEEVAVASGTGFFINKDGNIISNNHVIDGCTSMKVLIDGVEYPADVVAFDKANDIALLKTTYENNFYFDISEEDVQRTSEIKAIGYGFGKSYSSDIKVTAGIVSSLSGYNDNYSEFQMDAAIQSGNSGGPVVNKDGFVVGISVAALDSMAVYEDTGTLPQNVNYAIKSSTLKQFLKAKETKYTEGSTGWFSGSKSERELNELIDNAAVYLSCYMTYASLQENMTSKVMFENID